MQRNNEKMATTFFEIQDAVAYNIPVDSDSIFYVDLTPYRTDFTERELFLSLNINPSTQDCNEIGRGKKIFLSGYRGTGKTSELLKITKNIDETQCYFTVFVDIADEEMDTSNIDTVDILILMLRKLLSKLEKKGADISNATYIEDFYEWYKSTIIKESNTQLDASAEIKAGVDASASVLGKLLGIVANTSAKLQGSNQSKETIRRVITNNYKMFSDRFNELVNSVVTKLQEHSDYKDILFIVDGFEKIGSLKDRKKILVDDSNRLTMLNTHMIITLPIELFTYKNQLAQGAITMSFPIIDLDTSGAKECFREFILKRVSQGLFDDKAIDKLANEIAAISSKEELEIIDKIIKKQPIFEDEIFLSLKERNIIFEYGSDKMKINPIVLENRKLQSLLETYI